jgi:peptidoglycan/LPS O-acetylase OafA/YrhL
MGVVLGRRYVERGPSTGRRDADGGVLAAVALGSLVFVLAMVPKIPNELLDYCLQPAFAMLIYGLALGGGWIGALLVKAPIVFLGEASYAFYLLHIVVTILVGHMMGIKTGVYVEAAESQMQWWQTAICLAASLGASCLTLVFIERPARAAIRRIFATQKGTEMEAQH